MGGGFEATVINCCSMGNLSVINGLSSHRVGAIHKASTANITHKNCYYLSGINIDNSSSTPITFILDKITGDNIFYKTSDDPDAMTTAKVVTALNSYIESNEDEVDTTGWCKWVVGDNNLPALDFDTEWNGTTWVTASN